MELQERKPTFKGPADWFTGDVYVDPLAQGQGPSPVTLGWVHFTPCAHTAWHCHSFGQTLCVTEGEGFVQARGGPLIRIRAGDVIVTPPGEWHWHGAAPDRFMTHVTMYEAAPDGEETTWGETVSDEDYAAQPEERGR